MFGMIKNSKLDNKEDIEYVLNAKAIVTALDELQLGQVKCLDEVAMLNETVENLLREMVNLRLECRHIWRSRSRPNRYRRRNLTPQMRRIRGHSGS